MTNWATARNLVEALSALQLPHVFNPYRDICPIYDLPTAPAIRRANLELTLTAVLSQGADTLWVGQELGRNGGRRTGLPLTDEPGLVHLARYWGVQGLQRATHGPEIKEDTADFVWRGVAAEPGQVFFWNVFPLQSFGREDPDKNRKHTIAERREASHFLPWLIETLKPKKVVAMGRIAEDALRRLGHDAPYVRHPSFGGGPTFLADLARLRQGA